MCCYSSHMRSDCLPTKHNLPKAVKKFDLSQVGFNLIRESVDSQCRDGADTPMPPYIGKAFTRTNFEDLSLFI